MPYADLSDVRCHYETRGQGDPLLLVAGLGATCQSWECADALAQSFTLIIPDNRGLGRSTPKRPAQSLDDLAIDLVELLDHLQLDQSHVLGLSLGGIIAQKLAVDHPARVDRLVLVSCANRFSFRSTEMAKLLGQALWHFPPDVFQRTIELLGSAPQFLDAHPEEVERKIAAAQQAGTSRSALARQLRCLGSCREVAGGREYRILAPTLVMAGDQDNLIPACYSRQMAQEIEGSQFILIRDCGHNPLVEKPEVALPRIVRFLSADDDTETLRYWGFLENDLTVKEVV